MTKRTHLRQALASNEVKASILLFVVATVAFSLPFIIDLPYLIPPVLVLCGFACFTTGLILLTFHRTDLIAMDIAGVIMSGELIAFGKLVSDLGGGGGAVIIPGENPVQFIPVVESICTDSVLKSYLGQWNGNTGLLLPPVALPLLHHLKRRNHLIILDDEGQALTAYTEAVISALELADRVKGNIDGDTCTIEISWYTFYEGCAYVRNASPSCCIMTPCGVCGLAGLILAEATGQPWQFSEIQLIPTNRSVKIVLSRGDR